MKFLKPGEALKKGGKKNFRVKMIGMLRGEEVDKLFFHIEEIFKETELTSDIKAKIKRIWQTFSAILKSFDDDVEDFTTQFLEYFRFTNIPIYLHVLVEHYNDKVKAYGGLKKFSQEGVESHHLYEKQVQSRQTNGGGGKKTTEYSKQNMYQKIITVEFRRIMTTNECIYYDEDEIVTSKLQS